MKCLNCRPEAATACRAVIHRFGFWGPNLTNVNKFVLTHFELLTFKMWTMEKNIFVWMYLTMTTQPQTEYDSLFAPRLLQAMIPYHLISTFLITSPTQAVYDSFSPADYDLILITFSPPLNDSLTPSHHLQPLYDTWSPSPLLLTMIWLFITSCWLYLILYHLLQPLNDSLSPSRLLLTMIWFFITFLPPVAYKCFTSCIL